MQKRIILFDGNINGSYVTAWKEKREFIVQVWKNRPMDGEPDGDWAMPYVLGLNASIHQAILQTNLRKKANA